MGLFYLYVSDYLDLALTFRLFLFNLLTLFFLHLSLILKYWWLVIKKEEKEEKENRKKKI